MASIPSPIGAVEFLPRLKFSDKEISSFDCGTAILNDWLKQFSRSSAKKGLTTTIMVGESTKTPVLGFSTVCAATVEKDNLPENRRSGLGSYPVPVILIARFAISVNHKRQGLGKRQLIHIFKTVHDTISQGVIGARGIVVDAKDQVAVEFYSAFDLEIMAGELVFPKRMFIAYETIKDALTP